MARAGGRDVVGLPAQGVGERRQMNAFKWAWQSAPWHAPIVTVE